MSETGDHEENVKQTIEMLQQILEVMPTDISTLKTLYNTYLQLGDLEPALDVLARMETAATSINDQVALAFILEQYASVEHISPEIKASTDRLRAMQEGVHTDKKVVPEATSTDPVLGTVSLEAEMALAWDMLQDEQLTQDEYSEVVGDLTEMAATDVGIPVTMLHVLNDRNFSRFERLMTHLAEKASVPIISLESFEENQEASQALSLAFSSLHGALAYSMIGNDLLLAVLNPFDQELFAKSEKESGRVCHPYLVSPYEYDKRLGERKQTALGKEKEEE